MKQLTRRLRQLSFVIAVWSFGAGPAWAVNFYWDGGTVDLVDPGNSASLGGVGTWNSTTLNWDSGTYSAWPASGTANDAFFGGTAGTVTVAEPLTMHNLTFETTGYTLSGAGTLTTNGTTPSITTGTGITASIGVPLAGTVGFTKLGMGTLSLTAANTHTGITTVTYGTVNVSGDQSAANGGWYIGTSDNTAGTSRTVSFTAGSTIAVAADKVFQLGAPSASGTATTLNVAGTVTNAGALNVQRSATLNINSGATWTQSGALQIAPFSGSGASSALTVNSGGTFVYTGSSLISVSAAPSNGGLGTLTIGGLLTTGVGFTNATVTSSGSASIQMTGGTLRLTADVPVLTATAGSAFTFVMGTGGGTIDTNGFAATMTRPFSGSGNLTKAGAGTLTLTAASAHTGTTNVAGGTLLLNAGNNTLVSTTTVNFGGTGTLDLGTTTQTLGNLTFAPNLTATITGGVGAALTASPATLEFSPATISASPTTIDLTGLPSFSYSNATGIVSASSLTAAGASATGVVTVNLANSNSITASQFRVAAFGMGDSAGGNNTVVNLGQTNTLQANTINVGASGSRASGTLKFAAGLTAPSLTIAGTTGGTSKANLNVGSFDNFDSNNAYTATLNTTGGTLNAQFGNIVIGRNVPTSSTSTRDGRNTSTFAMGAGTMTADALSIGVIGSRTTNTGTYNFITTGLFSIANGGTANIGAITIAANGYTDGLTGTNSLNAQLTLLDGTLNATTITRGTIATPSSGTLAVTAQINWTTGTIGNLAGTDLAISSLPILLTSASEHTFNISGTNAGTVASTSIISGASSGISKIGTGSLILEAANTYGGGTTISAGKLLANNTTGSATGTAAVVVNANGTLGGSGIIAGATTVAGTLAPGNSIDSLTINNTLALSGTAAFEINDTLATADLVDGVTTLTFGGSLVVTNLGSGTDYVAGQTFNLFDFATASGTFASISLPTLPGGLSWQVYGAQTFDYATGQIAVVAAIPEPSTLGLAGLGLLGLAGLRFRRQRQRSAS